MMEVAFYHLTRRTLEQALPLLLERSLERGWRVVVQVAGADRLARLDEALWSYKAESFLPHSAAADGASDQPIFLTSGVENPNAADVRFFVDGARAAPSLADDRLRPRERSVIVFNDMEKEDAREQWRELLRSGYPLAYWQEDENGKFHKVKEHKP